jgi:hypothetical protein
LKDSAQIAQMTFFLQPLLKIQYGGVLKKHHGKCAHQAIVHAMIDFGLLAVIVDLPEALG